MKLALHLLVLSSVFAWQPTTRRVFVDTGIASIFTIPLVASAGVDVTGLNLDAGSKNSLILDQLKGVPKSDDGSGAGRVREIKEISAPTTVKAPTATPASTTTTRPDFLRPTISSSVSSFAIRYGSYTRLSKRGLGDKQRYNDYVVNGYNGRASVEFEFPSDWLQLDKLGGGIQYVDQRNGDKLYVLTLSLPEGETLDSLPKKFFADAIFDPKGAIARSGSTVDDYKVVRSEMMNPFRRRLTMKYATVTGNGLRVERRGLVDVQVIKGQVYMLMTGSNAAKFEAKGRERDTVEAIVDSFRCDQT